MSLNGATFPSLHHRKEGWLRHPKDFAKPPKRTQTGWFSVLFSKGKPPRLLLRLRAAALALRGCLRMLRDIFLIAQPPLLAVMQGGE